MSEIAKFIELYGNGNKLICSKNLGMTNKEYDTILWYEEKCQLSEFADGIIKNVRDWNGLFASTKAFMYMYNTRMFTMSTFRYLLNDENYTNSKDALINDITSLEKDMVWNLDDIMDEVSGILEDTFVLSKLHDMIDIPFIPLIMMGNDVIPSLLMCIVDEFGICAVIEANKNAFTIIWSRYITDVSSANTLNTFKALKVEALKKRLAEIKKDNNNVNLKWLQRRNTNDHKMELAARWCVIQSFAKSPFKDLLERSYHSELKNKELLCLYTSINRDEIKNCVYFLDKNWNVYMLWTNAIYKVGSVYKMDVLTKYVSRFRYSNKFIDDYRPRTPFSGSYGVYIGTTNRQKGTATPIKESDSLRIYGEKVYNKFFKGQE